MIGTMPPNNVYSPLPWQIPAWRDISQILLLTGSAGGGKSRLAAEKIHGALLKYPGAVGLMLRKAREYSLRSQVPLMTRHVIDPRHARLVKSETAFYYHNGSILYWGGMKNDEQREALRSMGPDGALDFVWIEEANSLSEQDFNEVGARMRGTAAPWRQIILATNPDGPRHWINERLIIGGEASVYTSQASDNPHLPDDYREWLNRLTGVQRERLVLGRWVMAEGALYPNFDISLNVTKEAEYKPGAGPVIWGCDDGYAKGHERVVLIGQKTPIGGVNIFYEYSRTGQSYDATLDEILALKYPKPSVCSVDRSSPTLRGYIHNRGIGTSPGNQSGPASPWNVENGIAAVRQLLCDGNGVRLIKIHPRCKKLIAGIQSYRADDSGRPIKENDNEVDALRYLCRYL